MRVSSRLTAFETVAFDNPSSEAARPKEPVSTTLAKIAQASKSGKRMRQIPEMMDFHRFAFSLG